MNIRYEYVLNVSKPELIRSKRDKTLLLLAFNMRLNVENNINYTYDIRNKYFDYETKTFINLFDQSIH